MLAQHLDRASPSSIQCLGWTSLTSVALKLIHGYGFFLPYSLMQRV